MNAVRKLLSPSYWLSDSPIAAWLRGAGWLFTSSLIERAAALVQTVMIARAIGIDDYGRYALLFSTISLLAPVIGLQLPYAIIYFVARYQEREPERAGAVVLLGRRLTLATTATAILVALIFSLSLSQWLFDAADYRMAIILGAVILSASVQSGLSDTLLQASEKFRTLALARLSAALLTLAMLAPVAILTTGLTPVLLVIAGGGLVRLAMVAIPARRISARLVAHTDFRAALRQGSVILHFSLPSGLLSLLIGVSTWIGNYYLTREPDRLKDMAIINTGVQWRAPILVVMASLSSAILPMLGRYLGTADHAKTNRLQRYHILLNTGTALAFAIVAILSSGWILAAYGQAFRGEQFLFSLFLVVLVPTAYVTARQQELVASGRMWTQLVLSIPFAAITIFGTLWFADGLRGDILGYIQLSAWVVTALLYGLLVRPPGTAAQSVKEG